MTNPHGEAATFAAQPKADVRENFTPQPQHEWGNVSRQCFADNSQWNAARGGQGGDHTLDKGALSSGVLQFGSINDLLKGGNGAGGMSKGIDGGTGKGPEGISRGIDSGAGTGKAVDGAPKAADGAPKAGDGAPKAGDGAPKAGDGPPKAGEPAPKGDAPPSAGDGSGKAGDNRASTLFSKDSTDEQKLNAARDLAKSGITNVSYRDSDGVDHKARLEVEKAGSREMVHAFTTGADGKERAALRGITNANGSFDHEKDRSGRSVDFKGSGYNDLAGGSGDAPARPAESQPGRPAESRPVDSQPGRPADAQPRPADAQPSRPADPDGRRPEAHSPKPGAETPPAGAKPEQPGKPEGPAKPEAPKEGADGKSTELPPGAIDRSQFSKQLEDPKVMAAFAGRMHSEVGSQGKGAQIAFAEEVMNRAASRNQTLMQALSGSYYPTSHPGRSSNPDYVDSIKTAWKQGTDTIHGATGNASGRVGFGVSGGHYDSNHRWVSPNQTANIGGERFGVEQVDINKGWLKKYAALKTPEQSAIASRD